MLAQIDFQSLSSAFFQAIDRHDKTLSEEERHRYWGHLLGYPKRKVEFYALARTSRPDLWSKREKVSFFPDDLGSEFERNFGGFSSFESLAEQEIITFHDAVRRVVAKFNEMKRSANSYIEVLNNWTL